MPWEGPGWAAGSPGGGQPQLGAAQWGRARDPAEVDATISAEIECVGGLLDSLLAGAGSARGGHCQGQLAPTPDPGRAPRAERCVLEASPNGARQGQPAPTPGHGRAPRAELYALEAAPNGAHQDAALLARRCLDLERDLADAREEAERLRSACLALEEERRLLGADLQRHRLEDELYIAQELELRRVRGEVQEMHARVAALHCELERATAAGAPSAALGEPAREAPETSEALELCRLLEEETAALPRCREGMAELRVAPGENMNCQPVQARLPGPPRWAQELLASPPPPGRRLPERAPAAADAAARALRGLFSAPIGCSGPAQARRDQASPPEQGDAGEADAAAREGVSAAWLWLAVRACAASGARLGSRTVPLREAQASLTASPLPRSASAGHLRAAPAAPEGAGRPAEERGLVQHLHGQVRSLEQRLQASERRAAELELACGAGAASAGPAEPGHARPVSPSRRAARHAGLCRDLEGLLAKQGQSRQAIVEELRTFLVDYRGRAHGDKMERAQRGVRSPRGQTPQDKAEADGSRALQRAGARGGA